ncbi:MAG TPA: class I SAM-dependent methyltransferase [Steroidobacteraceae bacterium]|nr:class I SAM-dependent methyltransferase [Steroidobacteraceae bacterium]
MRVRDSSMPDRVLWESFFEPTEILELLSLPVTGDIVDFGCGYGTFTLTAATLTRATVYGIDIDPEMVRTTARGALEAGLSNVCAVERNFVANGAGLAPGSCSYAMLFNILHAEDAVGLLRQAHEVLHPGGRVAVIHWVSDPGTPRGPPLQIRPTPQECQQWMQAAGFDLASPVVQLPPFHYGLVGRRPAP